MSLSAQVKRVFSEPQQWGLRGDPFLWDELRAHFLKTELPATSEEFVPLVTSKIEDLIDSDLRSDQPILSSDTTLAVCPVATSVPSGGEKREFRYCKASTLHRNHFQPPGKTVRSKSRPFLCNQQKTYLSHASQTRRP